MSVPPDVGPVDLGTGYIGFREIFEAHPLCRVIRVPTEGQGHEPQVLHEERNWIGHVNASPTQAHLLTFCHEGPWQRVEQRMWAMDMNGGRVWKLRPQRDDEAVGHEYWMADGLTIGYHGWREGERGAALNAVNGGDETHPTPSTRQSALKMSFYGLVRHDNSERVEVPFPHNSHHFHSNTPELIAADGPARERTPYVLLCRFDGERFEGPRVLCSTVAAGTSSTCTCIRVSRRMGARCCSRRTRADMGSCSWRRFRRSRSFRAWRR
jgi:oligogalacturonide lyase